MTVRGASRVNILSVRLAFVAHANQVDIVAIGLLCAWIAHQARSKISLPSLYVLAAQLENIKTKLAAVFA